MPNKKSPDSHQDFNNFNLTVEQHKAAILTSYLKALEGKSDGEALKFMLEELALMFAANTSLRWQVEDLKKENESRKKELVAITGEQKKIHKYYKDQFSKNSGWRWWI